ncbi:hypothetical protein O6H91_08G063300 [Diphasiastrum complanatum]|uniref:Uncharacterized protein n=1 Tax=Diphasiastrum complanatum TaxID=34168 RepID=A0ACC2CY82_DIPCM|nr:hypothetical protein O6H91_Y489300 [Diphasiastrum complanatum]KAJ7546979.1 hypothetical protein O6H91_08G063300 [Diphasiastrum complanatum]
MIRVIIWILVYCLSFGSWQHVFCIRTLHLQTSSSFFPSSFQHPNLSETLQERSQSVRNRNQRITSDNMVVAKGGFWKMYSHTYSSSNKLLLKFSKLPKYAPNPPSGPSPIGSRFPHRKKKSQTESP